MRSRSNILEKALSLFLALSLLLLSSCTKKPKKYTSSEADEITVYVTDTGHKYHKEKCSYLKLTKNKITLAEAIEDGYTPCLVCVPPEIED